MATEKTKKEKVSSTQPTENVKKGTAKEVSKKPTSVKAVKSETKTIKKAPALKEVTPVVENNEVVTPDKKIKKAKTNTANQAQQIAQVVEETKPTIKENVLPKPVEKKASVKKTATAKAPAPVTATEVREEDATVEAAPLVESVNEPTSIEAPQTLKVTFQLKYSSRFGQQLFVLGNNDILGNGDVAKAFPLQYFNQEYWYADLQLPVSSPSIAYSYGIINQDGSVAVEGGNGRVINTAQIKSGEVLLVDTWNDRTEDASDAEPVNTMPAINSTENFTHVFKVKAPQLLTNHAVFITGNTPELGNWTEDNIHLLTLHGNEWSLSIDLTQASLPVEYKYGIYNVADKRFVELEAGDNRVFYGSVEPKKLTIISDGIIFLSSEVFKVAVQ